MFLRLWLLFSFFYFVLLTSPPLSGSAKTGFNVNEVFDRIGTQAFGVKGSGAAGKKPAAASTSASPPVSSPPGKEGIVDLDKPAPPKEGCSC